MPDIAIGIVAVIAVVIGILMLTLRFRGAAADATAIEPVRFFSTV